VNEPSYLTFKKFSQSPKIRLEFQGYESQAFMSHLGKLQTNYTTDDSQNYLMLREPKKAYYIS